MRDCRRRARPARCGRAPGTREALRAQLEAWFARREDPALSGWRAEVDGLGQGAPLT